MVLPRTPLRLMPGGVFFTLAIMRNGFGPGLVVYSGIYCVKAVV
ncbi:hypothetical protein OHJ21_13050 [Virgibacillus sp. LDC1]|nr:hypothetical protein [Virgibacillus sp. LDC1]